MNQPLNLEDIQTLFEAVQNAQIFSDQKAMADAVPLFSVSNIMDKYRQSKDHLGFDLKKFILANFKVRTLDQQEEENEAPLLPIEVHIENLWDQLTRTAYGGDGTLIKLPCPYIVPGGRFEEFFYWDSYFVMLGLQSSNRVEMMKNIVDNCSFLILEFGFVPNANRTYFLGRSQPPFFSLMIDLLAKSSQNDNIYTTYFESLEKEYQFWMTGSEDLKNGEAKKRVLRTKQGHLLNRYFDEKNQPRPESFAIDVNDAEKSSNIRFFQNLRAACESGWDFSSRWFKDEKQIETIHILDLAQVDLNCLLWHLEITLSKTAKLLNNPLSEKKYSDLAAQRKANIQAYFWDEEAKIYKDFDFIQNKTTRSEHLASLYPLFFIISTEKQAKAMHTAILEKFLFPGGLVTTTMQSGQQWDFPNAWAPFQWMGFVAMKNYGFIETAEKIKNHWCSNVERIYSNTGKLMEKYNVTDKTSIAGGGEYPNQDGFGWTNGVYAKFKTQ